MFFRLYQLNGIYEKLKYLSGEDFLTVLLEEFQLCYEIHEEDLKRIPKEVPFITVSNHPLGAIDGIFLMKVLSRLRLDYKVMANFLFDSIKPIQPYIFPVNSFENHEKSSLSSIR